MERKSLLAVVVATLAVQAAAIAGNEAKMDPPATTPAVAARADGEPTKGQVSGRVKPHNHNEFHKQGAPAADKSGATAKAVKPLHDHGQTHKQQ